MPACHGADRLHARIALRDDRRLHLRRPVPPLASARENLETLNPAGASIITWHRHSTSALSDQARRLGVTPQPRKVAAEQRLPSFLLSHRFYENPVPTFSHDALMTGFFESCCDNAGCLTDHVDTHRYGRHPRHRVDCFHPRISADEEIG